MAGYAHACFIISLMIAVNIDRSIDRYRKIKEEVKNFYSTINRRTAVERSVNRWIEGPSALQTLSGSLGESLLEGRGTLWTA